MDTLVDSIRSYVEGDQLQALVMAAIIIVATAIISHIATKIIRKLMRVNGSLLPESSILVNIARAVIWVLGISIMLSACFNVDVNALIAALGVGGIAISLGLQDTIKNFIGGLQVTLMGIVHPGDHIAVGEVDGIVKDVSWRQTVVEDYEGAIYLIPNSVINSTTVQKTEPTLLVATMISFVNDGRDLDAMIHEMEQLAKQAIEEITPLEKDPWILMTQIGEYGIWAKMRFVLKNATYAREARDAALRAIAPYTRNNAPEMLHDGGEED